MTTQNPLNLNSKEFLTLAILFIVNKCPQTGISLISELEKYKILIANGTLYSLLSSLCRNNILKQQYMEPDSGNIKRHYHITPKGEIYFKELQQKFLLLNDTINKIRRTNKPQ